MNTKPLTDLASDLEDGGITKKLAARKLRDWIRDNKGFDLPITPIQPSNPFVPPYAPMPTPYPPPRPPFGYNNSCPKCGIALSSAMAYSCPNSDCPVGLGPIMCGQKSWSDDGLDAKLRVTFTDGSSRTFSAVSGDTWSAKWRGNEVVKLTVNGNDLSRNAVIAEAS